MASSPLRRWRRLALWLLGLLLLSLPALLIGLQSPSPLDRGVRVVDVVAAVPEAGGFQPSSVQVRAGQKLRLRFHAADTAHGVALGPGLGMDLGDLLPGEVKVVDVTFDEAGAYTFYCNKWCSPNHWRMRGTVQVEDREEPVAARDPVIDNLVAAGINIDAGVGHEHTAAHTGAGSTDGAAPASQPAPAPQAAAGAQEVGGLTVPPDLQHLQWRRQHTPLEAEARLQEANPQATPAVISNVVAYLWLTPQATAQDSTRSAAAAQLYAKNCAACHGETGAGDGFAAAAQPQPPPSFADASHMATRRSDVLYAKIRRGGMGTGMPNFGTLFSPEETWALVDYLWLLAFGR